MRGLVAGRDVELASVREFVASVSDGAAALVLQGEAGVGKTTVWDAGTAEAEGGGLLVLRARPAEGETALSFSGLRDLLEPVLDDVLAPLPGLQRRGLSHALVLEADEGPAPDRHTIGVALLSVLRELVQERTVLAAVDDVQWLDAESAAALAYAARRLRGERTGLLMTRRTSAPSALVDELARALPAGRFRVLAVDPLGASALHEVLVEQLGVALPAPLLAEVHAASGGNPFYALEIVRMLRRKRVLVEAGQPLPVPESLHDLVHGRLRALPAGSRDFLLAASADPQPTVALAEGASGVTRRDGLAPAVDAGIVELDGDRIRFTHPLLAAGAYELASAERRAEVHARLAELAEDPEARGRHLAVSVTQPSRAVAVALDQAAERALARGAPRAAALLLERARALTPPDDEQSTRRALDAASAHHEAGDTERARGLFESELERLPAGDERAQALFGLARVRSYDDDLRGAAALFEEAATTAEAGSVAQALAREGVSGTLFRLRERLAESVELSGRAAEAARVHGVPVLLAEALATKALSEATLGRPEAAATAKEALALQDACGDRPILRQPRFAATVVTFWHDDLFAARREYERMADLAGELGDESSLPYVHVMLGQIDCALGRFESALRQTEAGLTIAEQAGQRTLTAYLLAVRAVAAAHLGRVGEATSSGTQALELASSTSGIPAWIFASWALGHLALSQGDTAAALERLEPLRLHHRREAIEEPGALPFLPDGIEALLEAGRSADAMETLDGYHATAVRLGRQRGLAAALRCRGLLTGSVEELEEAVRLAAANDTPFDHARALLALGAAQRRAKRRREGRETLEAALAAFERLGTALWAERARAELRRISGRAATPGALTPAEARVAALVAEGRTNREVAAALFLSERTVEGHLSRVFGKLGVRSRTELARELARETSEPA